MRTIPSCSFIFYFYVAADMFAKEVCEGIGWCVNGGELFKHHYSNNSVSEDTN